MSQWRTPNEMLRLACETMLDGRTPETKLDWQLVVNCWACNVHLDVAVEAILLLCLLFEAPITEMEVRRIVAAQEQFMRALL